MTFPFPNVKCDKKQGTRALRSLAKATARRKKQTHTSGENANKSM